MSEEPLAQAGIVVAMAQVAGHAEAALAEDVQPRRPPTLAWGPASLPPPAEFPAA